VPRQANVTQGHRHWSFIDGGQRLVRICRGGYLVPSRVQPSAEQLPNSGLVVDDEYRRRDVRGIGDALAC
jgi:hypothetical protein